MEVEVAVVVLFFSLLAAVQGYYVKVEPHEQECFFEEVSMGTQFSLTFEVAEGGFLDIDVKISGPNGEIIYQGNQETNGKYTFAARVDGRHKFCFSNEMSSLTPKVLMFSVDVGNKPQEGIEDTAEDHNNLEKMINQLSTGLTGIKHEQEYMEVRERVHRAINDSTNSRVVLWAFFESLILVAMTLGQVYYLKRFFEVRRVV